MLTLANSNPPVSSNFITVISYLIMPVSNRMQNVHTSMYIVSALGCNRGHYQLVAMTTVDH